LLSYISTQEFLRTRGKCIEKHEAQPSAFRTSRVSTQNRFLSASVSSANRFFFGTDASLWDSPNAATFFGVQEFETESKPWKFFSHNDGLADSQILSRGKFSWRSLRAYVELIMHSRDVSRVLYGAIMNSNWPIVAFTITWAFYNIEYMMVLKIKLC